MQIRVKLMGMLKDRMPADGQLTLPDSGTISDVLRMLEIPPASVQVFTVNGQLVRQATHPLSEGDELLVLPPAGGG